MKRILMNKNTKILLAEYDNVNGVFSKIYEVYNIECAPYILKNYYIKNDVNNDNFRINLSVWFKERGIPS